MVRFMTRTITAAVVVLVAHTAAVAQVWEVGQNALDNASSGAVRERAPGNLVSAGVARTIEFGDAARAGVEITEPAPTISIWAQAAAQTIASIFEQLNQAIQAINTLLIARGGQTPTVPSPTPGDGETTIDDLFNNSGGRR